MGLELVDAVTNKSVFFLHKSSLEVGSLSLGSVFMILLLMSWIILSSWWFAHLCGRIVFFMLSSDHKMADFHLLCKQKEKEGNRKSWYLYQKEKSYLERSLLSFGQNHVTWTLLSYKNSKDWMLSTGHIAIMMKKAGFSGRKQKGCLVLISSFSGIYLFSYQEISLLKLGLVFLSMPRELQTGKAVVSSQVCLRIWKRC